MKIFKNVFICAIVKKLQDNTAILTNQTGLRETKMKSVIFVIDELVSVLQSLVKTGLGEADRNFMSHVTMPVFRTGAMLGVIEETLEEVVKEMMIGIQTHVLVNPHTRINTVTIVVYQDQQLFELVQKWIEKLDLFI